MSSYYNSYDPETISAINYQTQSIKAIQNDRMEREINDLLYSLYEKLGDARKVNISGLSDIRYYVSSTAKKTIANYNHYDDIYAPKIGIWDIGLGLLSVLALIVAASFILQGQAHSIGYKYAIFTVLVSARPAWSALAYLKYSTNLKEKREKWYKEAYGQMFKDWFAHWPILTGNQILEKALLHLIVMDLFDDLSNQNEVRSLKALNAFYGLIFRANGIFDSLEYPFHKDIMASVPNRKDSYMYIDHYALELYDEYRSKCISTNK